MTGPRFTTVLPHRIRARRLLPFLAVVLLAPLACTEQPTAPQSTEAGPVASATRLHPYLANKGNQIAPAAQSAVRAFMSARSVTAAGSATVGASSAPRVLILSDIDGPTTTALANSIAAAGFEVGVKPAPEYNWFGTNPAPSEYNVVIHLNGATYALPLSAGAQDSLTTFVSNGGGFIGAQWNGSEESQGQQSGMSNLVLLGSGEENGENCADCDVRYTVVPGHESHPLLAGLPSSFTIHADGHDASAKAGINPANVLMTVSSGGPAVVAQDFVAGKVVNFSFAPNYGLTGTSGMLLDSQVQQLYVNAVRWSSGSNGNPGTGSVDSDADGVIDGVDNCVNKENANQTDTDTDGVGDVCDPDADGDGVLNNDDNCELYNPDQADVNENWIGDVCEEVQTQAQTIEFTPLPDRTIIEPAFQISAAASSGLPVTFAASGTCTLNESTVTLTGVGSCTIFAQQGGSSGFSAAPTVEQSFNITKAPATLTVGTEYTYDGTVKQATITTSPAGLTGVTVTYTQAGFPVSRPVNAGVYEVVATLENASYDAPTASGTLTIHPAASVISWASPAPITAGTSLSSTQLNAIASTLGGVNLGGDFVYLPAEGAVLSVGAAQPISVEFFPANSNYTSSIKTVPITVLAVEVPPSRLKFNGFFQPVYNMPTLNAVAAGSAISVKFSVEGSTSAKVLQAGSPTSMSVACAAGKSEKRLHATVDMASSRLVSTAAQYTYIWKTDAAWAGTCRKLVVTLVDGSSHAALFRFGKEQKVVAVKRQNEKKSTKPNRGK